MKTLLLISSFLLFVISTGCNKPPQIVEPPCITEKVNLFSQNVICESGASVKEYEFKGDLVYVFDDRICITDGVAAVIGYDCDTIGWLGGVSVNTEIKGVNFHNKAELQRTLFGN